MIVKGYDLKFGDHVWIDERVYIVSRFTGCEEFKLISMINTFYGEQDREYILMPKPGDMVTVYDKPQDKSERMFLRYDFESGGYPFICVSLDGSFEGRVSEVCGWKFLEGIDDLCEAPEEMEKKKRIDEILLAISEDDPKIWREVAEIVLATREKVSK